MYEVTIVSTLLIFLIFFTSYKGFKEKKYFQENLFDVQKIGVHKEYRRFFTSGFLHVSWFHLIFNVATLHAFSSSFEGINVWQYLIVYVLSLLGGNLLAYYVHRNHEDYTAVGASGAVCGIIFASIACNPDMQIGVFGLPYHISAWLYGLLFTLITIYGIKTQRDNIGHEAHLGGALVGMVAMILLKPNVIDSSYLAILAFFIPTSTFLFVLILRPNYLLLQDEVTAANKKYYDIEDEYNAKQRKKEISIDTILEKINKSGVDSLSKEEKKVLDNFSK